MTTVVLDVESELQLEVHNQQLALEKLRRVPKEFREPEELKQQAEKVAGALVQLWAFSRRTW